MLRNIMKIGGYGFAALFFANILNGNDSSHALNSPPAAASSQPNDETSLPLTCADIPGKLDDTTAKVDAIADALSKANAQPRSNALVLNKEQKEALFNARKALRIGSHIYAEARRLGGCGISAAQIADGEWDITKINGMMIALNVMDIAGEVIAPR